MLTAKAITDGYGNRRLSRIFDLKVGLSGFTNDRNIDTTQFYRHSWTTLDKLKNSENNVISLLFLNAAPVLNKFKLWDRVEFSLLYDTPEPVYHPNLLLYRKLLDELKSLEEKEKGILERWEAYKESLPKDSNDGSSLINKHLSRAWENMLVEIRGIIQVKKREIERAKETIPRDAKRQWKPNRFIALQIGHSKRIILGRSERVYYSFLSQSGKWRTFRNFDLMAKNLSKEE